MGVPRVFTWRALRRRTDTLIDLRLLRHPLLSSATLPLFLSGVASTAPCG
ncbi:hypothetical protein ROS62_17725 [Streptomyces sp. DSM 41972]|uniref:Uncharacterized protein n=1 Tax=Streptomyces althioticus subsp. attaecolombicae TaxID=3075534 RepID=A0ABU3I127_9ACTN|nr:hypothetical protein [Streptomyces sp. DSM 41972]